MAKRTAPPTPSTECPDVRECMGRLATLEANDVHLIAQVDSTRATVDRIDRAIRGNSEPGLMARTRSLEESREAQRSKRRWLRGICAAVIAAVVGALVVTTLGKPDRSVERSPDDLPARPLAFDRIDLP